MSKKEQQPATSTNATIELESPIKREGGDITTLTLRKPNAGELRGLSLLELMQMDAVSIQKLLPRITTPAIAEAEVQKMDLADFVQAATEVAGFLVPASRKDAHQ